MHVPNAYIAESLNKLANLLEFEGENPFKVRAYRTAARSIEDYPMNLSNIAEKGEFLPHLPGVGESISKKIEEIIQTGRLSALETMEQDTPASLAQLAQLQGLGPKRVKHLYDSLGIQTLADLTRAVEEHKIQSLPGFGVKTEENIRHELERRKQGGNRIKLAEAESIAAPLMEHIRHIPQIKKAVIAGSFRRRKETVGDLDILLTGTEPGHTMDQLVEYNDVAEVVSRGDTRTTVLLRSGLQVDFRLVPEDSYGAALLYFTGSKDHNIRLRTMALDEGWKINEYGVFEEGKTIAGRTEEEIYALFGLPYIEPELRENTGEIETAFNGRLPRLITTAALKGDLHAHTNASDGRASVKEVALAAKQRGYEYIAITDHTQNTRIANGLDPKRFRVHLAEIERVNQELTGITVLKSAEIDILEDGSLDLPDDILKELDIAVCSIHSQFRLSRKQQTERIIRAMDNPYFNILGHPSGRLINGRPPIDVDIEAVMSAAKERGCALEVNAQPSRLDLKDTYCRLAKEMRLKVVISSDTHQLGNLDNIRFGVDQARRGWLEEDDVLNTRSWKDMKQFFRQSR